MNTSTKPGYLLPNATNELPKNLTLTQFIQTLLVGLSEVSGPMIRPKWQPSPPKAPDINVNWIAFGISSGTPNANASVAMDKNGVTTLVRHERLDIGCSFYGPEAFENAGLVRDGFQIQQNLDALTFARMGFTETSAAQHIPDLVNERFRERVEMTIVLQREITRTYPIVSILSAKGTIHTVLGNEEYLLDWATPV